MVGAVPLWAAVRWYSVVVSISGCDPLDPGSNPGTAKTFLFVFSLFPFLATAVCNLGLGAALGRG